MHKPEQYLITAGGKVKCKRCMQGHLKRNNSVAILPCAIKISAMYMAGYQLN